MIQESTSPEIGDPPYDWQRGSPAAPIAYIRNMSPSSSRRAISRNSRSAANLRQPHLEYAVLHPDGAILQQVSDPRACLVARYIVAINHQHDPFTHRRASAQ
jgi:hypothetical protein